jgi:hypothetical protein
VARRDPGPPWTDAPPTANPFAKEHNVNTRTRLGQAPTAWDVPGWAPLVEPVPLQTVRSVGRWLWFTVAVGGFLLVTVFAFAHDDPSPGLSVRGLVTIALAGAVVVLLTMRRAAGPGPLARAMAEYAVVFLLAVLIATTGIPVDQPPTGGNTASAASDQRPALVKTLDGFRDWLSEWRQWAHNQSDRRDQSAPTTLTRSRFLPPSAVPHSTTRRPL